MERPKISQSYSFSGGYVSDSSLGVPLMDNAMVPPSRSVVYSRTGLPEAFAGVVPFGEQVRQNVFRVNRIGGTVRFPFGPVMAAGLGVTETETQYGRGSVFLYSGPCLFYIGRGGVIWDGRDGFIGEASSELKYFVPANIGGPGEPIYDGTLPGTGEFLVGIFAPPNAPDVAVSGSGLMKGSFSFRYTFARPIPGSGIISEGNPSPVSVAVLPEDEAVRVTFPNFGPTPIPPNSFINLYATPRGFGAIGPWYFLRAVEASDLTTVDGFPNSILVNFRDNELDLGRIPPLDHFRPPTGMYALPIRDTIAIVGASGGTTVVCSKPGAPEAFPPQNILALPDKPTGVLSDNNSGLGFISCASSLHAISYTGTQFGPPIDVTQIWSGVGVAHQGAMTLAGGDIYAFTKEGACRTGEGGQPDLSFAIPVRGFLSQWDEETACVGFDPRDNAVVFACGSEAIIYYPDKDKWSAPLELRDYIGPVSVSNFFTFRNALYFDAFSFQGNPLIEAGRFSQGFDRGASAYLTFEWGRFSGSSISVEAVAAEAPCGAITRSVATAPNWQAYSEMLFADTLWPKTINTVRAVGESNYNEYGLCGEAFADVRGVLEEIAAMIFRASGLPGQFLFAESIAATLKLILEGGLSLLPEATVECMRPILAFSGYYNPSLSSLDAARMIYRAFVGAELCWRLKEKFDEINLFSKTKDEMIEFFAAYRPVQSRWEFLAKRFLRSRYPEIDRRFTTSVLRFDRVLSKINLKNIVSVKAFMKGRGYGKVGGVFVEGEVFKRRISENVQPVVESTTGTVTVDSIPTGLRITWAFPNETRPYVIHIWNESLNRIVHVDYRPSWFADIPFPAWTQIRVIGYRHGIPVYDSGTIQIASPPPNASFCPLGGGPFTLGGDFSLSTVIMEGG